jgi:hypothetical protein
MNIGLQTVLKKRVHALDAHNSHINNDRIIVFYSDVLE